jgi:endonuclease/exonuclease/phosphatase family metal-dependent hydrolase
LHEADRPHTIRVATWNIHAARSAPLADIIGEIRDTGADIVALQEVDAHAARTGFVNQPKELADALGFHYVFAASIRFDGGDYGLALLSRWPLAEVIRHRLARPAQGEPRIVLEAVVCAAGHPLRIFNHHADIVADSRRADLAALVNIVRPRLNGRTIVLGDFNTTPDDAGIRALLDTGLVDPAAAENIRTADEGRIDYLLVDRVLASSVRRPEVWQTDKSDHDALVTEMRW